MQCRRLLGTIAIVIIIINLCGCAPSDPIRAILTPEPALPSTWTPYPIETTAVTLDHTQEYLLRCTGWKCSLDGVVYANTASDGNEQAGVKVLLKQISWCSPTRGEHETITDTDGAFSFEVYLHDTDTFWIEISVVGYKPVRQSIGGFDCLFCACDLQEIILLPAK